MRALRSRLDIMLDMHLMIVEPEQHLEAFVEAGAGRLIVHQETRLNLHGVLRSIRELGVEAGVALNPGTSLSAVQ